MEKKRIRDFGIIPGRVKTGKRNAITDVPGVLVGHCTVNTEENHTGVTVIIPGPDNAFANHYTAAAYVHNGFGKSAGLVQVEELGTLETPIALTNTLNVGKVWDALAGIVIEQCQNDGLEPMSINPVVGECNDCRINQIQKRAVGEKEVRQAFAAPSAFWFSQTLVQPKILYSTERLLVQKFWNGSRKRMIWLHPKKTKVRS